MKSRLQHALLLLAIPAALTAMPGPALANHLCGFVVTNPGTYVMTHDQTCPAGTAVTVSASNVTVDMNGFALIGQGTGEVGIVIEEGTDNVHVTDGFVRGFGTGIQIGDCSGIFPVAPTGDPVVEDVTVRNSGTYGIRMCEADGDPQIVNTAVIGSGLQGIEVRGQGTILGSVVRDTGTGVLLQPDPDTSEATSITASLIEDTTGTGVLAVGPTGGAISGAATVEIRDGQIRGTHRGVQTSGDVYPIVSGMTISDTTNEGIWIRGSTTPGLERAFLIENTTVSSVGGGIADAGIVVDDRPSGGTITSTTVRDVTSGAGIMLACFTTFVSVEDSQVRGATGDGILVSDASDVHGEACHSGAMPGAIFMTGNVLRGNGGNGVAVLTGDAHLLSDNLFRQNAGDGLFIDGDVGQTPPILNNIARGNGDDGFQFDTADLALTANAARGNGDWNFETNFIGPVAIDNGQTVTPGGCSDPSDLPNTTC